MNQAESKPITEFDRQVENLLRKGYPKAAGLSVSGFIEHVSPLRDKAAGLDVPEIDPDEGRLPFVIVIKSDLLPTEKAMPLVERDGRHGTVRLLNNNCFSLLASRHSGDRRVPAIWINGEKRPNLGWCWEGNPHTWLGSASCVGRVGLLEAERTEAV